MRNRIANADDGTRSDISAEEAAFFTDLIISSSPDQTIEALAHASWGSLEVAQIAGPHLQRYKPAPDESAYLLERSALATVVRLAALAVQDRREFVRFRFSETGMEAHAHAYDAFCL